MKRVVKFPVLCGFLLLALSAVPIANASPKAIKLSKSQLQTVKFSKKHALCGHILNKWVPVVAVTKGFLIEKSAGAKAILACASILPKSSVKIRSLTQLPSVAGLVSSSDIASRAFSGNPPSLAELSTMESDQLESTFWKDGEISAINDDDATDAQCSSVFSGQHDGDSGGFSACYMTQSIGFAFENILQASSSICYMQNAPTAAQISSGALSIVKGKFPDNDVTQLFVPGVAARTVKIDIIGSDDNEGGDDSGQSVKGRQGDGGNDDSGSQTIFIRITSVAANAQKGNQYHYDLWQCAGGVVTHHETTSVTTSGTFATIDEEAGNGGSYVNSVNAKLTNLNGHAIFDSSKDRTATSSFDSGFGPSFASQLIIAGNNKIYSKSFDTAGFAAHKSYSVSAISGSTVLDLALQEGANKDQYSGVQAPAGGSVTSSATEYRGTYYAAAPGSSLLSALDAVDFDTDSFYSEAPALDVDLSPYSCDAPVDVEVALDLSAVSMAPIVAQCHQKQFSNMNYCNSDDLIDAMTEFQNSCSDSDPH